MFVCRVLRNTMNEKIASKCNFLHNTTEVKRDGHAARKGGMRNAYRSSSENQKERDHLGDLGEDARLILTRISGKHAVSVRNGLICLCIV
jgi:hypothetical protein